MGIVLRPLEESAKKYADRAAAATGDYERGVKNPRRSQSANAIAAIPSMVAGFNEAASRGAPEKGLRKAGDAKWQDRAATLGKDRFVPGVNKGKGDWATGFAPSAAVLTALTLGEKGPRGSAANFERSRAVGVALAEKRKSGTS